MLVHEAGVGIMILGVGEEIELEEEYMTKLLKTITPKQYGELKRTEQSFNKKLLEKLQE